MPVLTLHGSVKGMVKGGFARAVPNRLEAVCVIRGVAMSCAIDARIMHGLQIRLGRIIITRYLA
jgi:hypothetical protein